MARTRSRHAPEITTPEPDGEVLDRAGLPRAVLDLLPANVFVADRDLRLVYMNAHASRTMAAIDPEVHAAFGLHHGQLLGGSIHRFHHDPKRVEAILADPRSFPHEAQFTFGPVALVTRIDVVRDDAGEVLCFVVAWEEVSSKLKAEREAAHLAEQVRALEEVLVGIETVAAATEEMAASIGEIAHSAATASATATEAVTSALDTNETLFQLRASIAEIANVATSITSIAEQTNLLALNATIEAARAGEAGRGFAVVASEVKELARRTTRATGEIAPMVEGIERATARMDDALAGISSVVRTIDESQGVIATAVQEQTTVTSEMSRDLALIIARAGEIVRLAKEGSRADTTDR